MTAASAFVLPVVEIDGVTIGDGRPGPVARAFRDLYIEEARNSECLTRDCEGVPPPATIPMR